MHGNIIELTKHSEIWYNIHENCNINAKNYYEIMRYRIGEQSKKINM